jgi:hypothetical protein
MTACLVWKNKARLQRRNLRKKRKSATMMFVRCFNKWEYKTTALKMHYAEHGSEILKIAKTLIFRPLKF